MVIWAVNLKVEPGNPDSNTQHIIGWIEKAKKIRNKGRTKPDFILFPEMCISGYLKERNSLVLLHEAIESNLQKIIGSSISLPESIFLVGYPFFGPMNRIYIRHTAVRNGECIFSHDKIRLSPSEQNTFTPGEDISVFSSSLSINGTAKGQLQQTKVSAFGILLCYENHFPELHSALAAEGCDIIFAPFASPRENPKQKYRRFLRFLPARAYDNTCFIVSCNLVQQYPNTGNSPGIAVIIGPKGDVLAKAVSRDESVCKAEIDLDELTRIRESKMGYFRASRQDFSSNPNVLKNIKRSREKADPRK